MLVPIIFHLHLRKHDGGGDEDDNDWNDHDSNADSSGVMNMLMMTEVIGDAGPLRSLIAFGHDAPLSYGKS